MRNAFILRTALMIGLLLTVCGAQGQKTRAVYIAVELRPVIVQGAMDLEVKKLASRLDNLRVEKVGGWTFWRGTLDGYPVIVSKTMKGVSNSAAATAIAAEHYHPVAIFNQGTAGGHVPELHVYDIVLGKYSVNLGAFRTAYRKPGQGGDFRGWIPLDLLVSEDSAGENPNAHIMRRFQGNEQLLAAAESVKHLYRKGRVVQGVIGSAEIWNSELDRIQWFHRQYGTTVEEMETASAAQIAGFFQIPFLGIRVLSNNITNGGTYDAKTGEACQEYVYDVVKAYIATTLKR
ncbi:MAG TPA: 5'-methylthioadenosine/S-adenosylhomocysteine nucleosidase [Pyrinomonadaceae bacterium]|nr:5'-methylthioadenosine/S-adenosylhomocysteine nucleosidase [Pyrinomonadaceae bacterium]